MLKRRRRGKIKFFFLGDLRKALNQEKMPKPFFGKYFKAVRIHPIFKALATPINLSTITIFEGHSLRDFIRGLPYLLDQ